MTKVTRPGAKRGVYPKRDIDALALTMNLALRMREKTVFSRSTPGDQVEEMDIGIRCFVNEFIAPLAKRIEFHRQTDLPSCLLNIDGMVVRHSSLFPFLPTF